MVFTSSSYLVQLTLIASKASNMGFLWDQQFSPTAKNKHEIESIRLDLTVDMKMDMNGCLSPCMRACNGLRMDGRTDGWMDG